MGSMCYYILKQDLILNNKSEAIHVL